MELNPVMPIDLNNGNINPVISLHEVSNENLYVFPVFCSILFFHLILHRINSFSEQFTKIESVPHTKQFMSLHKNQPVNAVRETLVFYCESQTKQTNSDCRTPGVPSC